MSAQLYCALCGETFEFEHKRGGQRRYCLNCEPEGYSVVTTRSGRKKLRRRVPVVRRADLELLWAESLRPRERPRPQVPGILWLATPIRTRRAGARARTRHED
jgi:hypothetical protein